jgi:hypothetical protein
VLAFTPDVETAIQWFAQTHDLQTADGVVRWRRLSLPSAGGNGDQDARLMQQLQLLRRVGNDLLREERARHAKREDYAAWQRQRQSEP